MGRRFTMRVDLSTVFLSILLYHSAVFADVCSFRLILRLAIRVVCSPTPVGYFSKYGLFSDVLQTNIACHKLWEIFTKLESKKEKKKQQQLLNSACYIRIETWMIWRHWIHRCPLLQCMIFHTSMCVVPNCNGITCPCFFCHRTGMFLQSQVSLSLDQGGGLGRSCFVEHRATSPTGQRIKPWPWSRSSHHLKLVGSSLQEGSKTLGRASVLWTCSPCRETRQRGECPTTTAPIYIRVASGIEVAQIILSLCQGFYCAAISGACAKLSWPSVWPWVEKSKDVPGLWANVNAPLNSGHQEQLQNR